MLHHGISHASVALTSVLAGDLLARALGQFVPGVSNWLGERVVMLLGEAGVTVDTSLVGTVGIVLTLGFIWGIAFKLMES